MRVLVLGEDAPGSLAWSYHRAFVQLGAVADFYCLKRAYDAALPGLATRVGRRLLEPIAARAFQERLLHDLQPRRADVAFVVKGQALAPDTVCALRESLGAQIVNFYPDDPFSQMRSNRLTWGTAVLACYDVCFTFARHLIPRYREAGARDARYLPFASDPELHAPVAGIAPPEFDVVFVGNLSPERVEWLSVVADRKIGIFGERVQRELPARSQLRAATLGTAQYGAALARTLARGAISLNLMRPQNALSHNMRTFESPACGAFTLSQRTPELEALFREGEEVAAFSTADELREQVAFWLAHPADRRRVAAAGLERARASTYIDRARTVLAALGAPAGAAA